MSTSAKLLYILTSAAVNCFFGVSQLLEKTQSCWSEVHFILLSRVFFPVLLLIYYFLCANRSLRQWLHMSTMKIDRPTPAALAGEKCSQVTAEIHTSMAQ